MTRLRCIALLALCALATNAPAQAATRAPWVDAWSASPDSAGPPLVAQTVRQVVRTSVGGTRLRVRLSNRFGDGAVTFGPVHVAASASGASTVPGTDRVVTFSGQTTVIVAKGGEIASDPVAFAATPLQRIAVSVYLPLPTGASTLHGNGNETAYLASGDATAAVDFPAGETDTHRHFLADIEVDAGRDARALVVLGDSLTDGYRSSTGGDARWPDALAARLQSRATPAPVAVANAGISGNRLLHDGPGGPAALARCERDALDKAGVRWVLLLEGINDIGVADAPDTPADVVSAAQLIDGMKSLVAGIHARGLRAWAATLLPYAGSDLPYTASGEVKRQALNAWIRTSGAFDAVVDFDQAMRDPVHPDRLLPAFDSGDHLHPNDAGYAAMAAAVDLDLFAAHADAPQPPSAHRTW